MGSPLGAAKYNSLLQGAASLDRLGTTDLQHMFVQFHLVSCGASFVCIFLDSGSVWGASWSHAAEMTRQISISLNGVRLSTFTCAQSLAPPPNDEKALSCRADYTSHFQRWQTSSSFVWLAITRDFPFSWMSRTACAMELKLGLTFR